MRILHVTAGLGRSGAGVREMVLELSRAQMDAGMEVGVIGNARSDLGERVDWQDIPVMPVSIMGPTKFGYAPRRTAAVLQFNPEIVHLHGLWTHHGQSVLEWSQISKKPYLLTPHGMLAPAALAFSRVRKLVASRLFQAKVLAHATALHATSAQEENDIRSYGLTNSIVRFGNGVKNYPARVQSLEEPSSKTVLYLGRLHPIKGLDQLVEAWAGLETEFPDWRLIIAGPDSDGEELRLKTQIKRLGVSRVAFHGATWGEDKTSLMRSADIFALPSRSENFAITIAESLMVGVPVVVTNATPWSEVDNIECGRCVEFGAAPLLSALKEMMRLEPNERFRMGQRGRNWMLREFTWPMIAKQSLLSYEKVLGRVPF